MSAASATPAGVALGDVFEDLDLRRRGRRLRVVEQPSNAHGVWLRTESTGRLTQILGIRLLDRCRYRRVVTDSPSFSPTSNFAVTLVAFGASRIMGINEIRAFTGLGWKEALDLTKSLPALLKVSMFQTEAEAARKALEATGATVTIADFGPAADRAPNDRGDTPDVTRSKFFGTHEEAVEAVTKRLIGIIEAVVKAGTAGDTLKVVDATVEAVKMADVLKAMKALIIRLREEVAQ